MTMEELEGTVEYRYNVEILSKLVGLTIAKWTRKWDQGQKLVREFCDIKQISGVGLEIAPHKIVVLKFADGEKEFLTNLEQFSKYSGKIGEYGSIKEYLEDKGLSIFS